MEHKYIISDRIKKYDNEIEYISGYVDCYSVVKCYCNRCNNYFERKWCNLARKNTEYCCPICQTKLALDKTKQHSKPPTIKPIEEREYNFINRLFIKAPTFEYIKGYKDCESVVLLKCKICGLHKETTASCIRGKRKIRCKYCYKYICKKKKRLSDKKKCIKNIVNTYKQDINKELKKIQRKLIENTIYIKHCKYCNKEILVDNVQKQICGSCYHKRHKKHSTKSLKKLYKRDNGICYICGGKVNLDDYTTINGNVICGDYYPSIDHIIPISKGGSDNWDNIKLAHRLCNTLKGNSTFLERGL